MNKQERKIHPLVSRTNKVWVNIATLPDRVKQLEKTIESIYDQADRIVVMLNGHKKEPGFLMEDKITTFLRNNEKGCSEKFYDTKNQTGYIFTADDDLIYPPNYVEKMIEKEGEYGGIVTFHGSILKSKVKNYYWDRRVVYQCLKRVANDVPIDIPGTGVMCYNSANYRFEYDRVQYKNMSDIYAAIFAKEQDVKMTVLAHESGWIKGQTVENDIYHRYASCCPTQTRLVNELLVKKPKESYHGFQPRTFQKYDVGLRGRKR